MPLALGPIPTQIDPLVRAVMNEVGIDVNGKKPKGLNVFQDYHFDYVVTVCDQANEACPIFPWAGKARIHKSFSDPSKFQGWHDDVIKVI